MLSAGELGRAMGMTLPVHHGQSARCATAGFTLLEILVVLSIASLMLTLVPLAFSGSVDLVRSKGAARELVATLQYARSRAVARNRIVDVDLDAGTGRYVVGAGGAVRDLPGGVRLILVEVDGSGDDSQHGRIRFFPDGSSSGGQLRLEDGVRRFHIAVHWLLGRVDVTQSDTS